jgi:phosphohistidine swiveling domain-containing protein
MGQEYFSKHLSLSDWAIKADVSDKQALISEDGSKRRRLKFLAGAIGLPIVHTAQFTFDQIMAPSTEFSSFLSVAGSTPYALRVNPKVPGLAVHRNRKLSVPDLVKWLGSLGLDGDEYEFSFEPHIDPELAAIFVVTESRIVGEAIKGGILQLNKGLHVSNECIQFEWEPSVWRYSQPMPPELADFIAEAVRAVKTEDGAKQSVVQREMGLGYANGYLTGYFEVIWSPDSGIIFIDYNRELLHTADRLRLAPEASGMDEKGVSIQGQSGCTGHARGIARVVGEQETAEGVSFSDGEILVCRFTSPEFVPLMLKAGGVVTDVGGILSHAAIICREIGKPCVVGTKVGTKKIVSGSAVEVDGDNGVVHVLSEGN